MADVITKFKLETTQYDSKLRDSAKRLKELTEHLSIAGRDFDKFAKGSVETARALGKVESGATNLKDKLKDLVGAYNQTARAYNALTKEQQQTDFGKAMAQSLQELQGRITETKNELYSTGGALSSLKEKLTINIDAMKLFNLGLQAAKAALDVAKDAFFQSETNIDEWGRTVKGAEGAYEVFLNTLNNGNWAHFLSNMGIAIQGARDLYDALDRLGSIKSNNQAAIALVQAEIQQLRVLKQQGKDVDDQIKDATQRLKALQNQSVAAGKVAGKKDVVNTLRNEVNSRNTVGAQINDATLRYVADRIFKEGESYINGARNVVSRYEGNAKYQSLRTSYTGSTPTLEKSFDINKLTEKQQKQYLISKAITEAETRIQSGISIYAQAVQEGASAAREEFRGNRYALQGSGGSGVGGGVSAGKEMTPLQDAEKQIADLTNEALTADEARQEVIKLQIAALNEQVKKYKEIQDYVQGKSTMELFPNLGLSNDGGSTLIQQMQDKIRTTLSDQKTLVDETTLSTMMTSAIQNGIDTLDPDFSLIREKMAEGMDITEEQWQNLEDKLNEQLAFLDLKPITIDFQTGNIKKINELATEGEKITKGWAKAASSIRSVGSALSQIEDPTAKVAAIILQAIASIALGAGEAIKNHGGKMHNGGPWGWIAFALSATATMISSIVAVKQATKGGFAQGGIVPGNSFSGDNLRTSDYGINSGELVLSKAQTNNIAALLEEPSYNSNGGGVSTISGEQIVTVVNAYGRRTGRGEILM